jgi:hypothetical protein
MSKPEKTKTSASDIIKNILNEDAQNIQKSNVSSTKSGQDKAETVDDPETAGAGATDGSDAEDIQKKNVAKENAAPRKTGANKTDTDTHMTFDKGKYDQKIMEAESDDDDDDAYEDDDDKNKSKKSDDDDGDDDKETPIKKKMDEMKNKQKKNLKEHTAALFMDGPEDLTEEFKEKTATLFEAAVTERTREVANLLEDEYNRVIEEATQNLEEQYEDRLNEQREEMVESLDAYLGYIAEEWMKNNKLAVENGLRTEITEEFMQGLKGLFESHFIDVPDEKFDLVGDLQEQLEAVKSQLDEQVANNSKLHQTNRNLLRENIINTVGYDLTETEKSRLSELVEDIDYDSDEQFTRKVQTIKESYFSDVPSGSRQLNEEAVSKESLFEDAKENANKPKNTDPYVNSLTESLGRFGDKRKQL